MKTAQPRKLLLDRGLVESGRRDLNPGPPEPHLTELGPEVGFYCCVPSRGSRLTPTSNHPKPADSGSNRPNIRPSR